jgi:lysine decarboxylase
VFIPRGWDEERGISSPISRQDVENLWEKHPTAKAVLLTSPTYYGVVSDIRGIAAFCHEKGMLLIVDAAHGAHFPWIGLANPCQQGADLTIVSAHKGLPAPGQSALLFYNGFAPEQVRQAASVYGSSSPSYWMMGALDGVRDYLDSSTEYLRLVENSLPKFQAELEQNTRFRLVKTDDPARVVVDTSLTGLTGFQMQEGLETCHIYVEMADLTHLVLITTCADGSGVFGRLLAALKVLDRAAPGSGERVILPQPPELPEVVLSLREAMFAPQEQVAFWDSEGRVSAQQIAPYPPGVPVVAPGERIEKKHLAYLEKIGYNRSDTIAVVANSE